MAEVCALVGDALGECSKLAVCLAAPTAAAGAEASKLLCKVVSILMEVLERSSQQHQELIRIRNRSAEMRAFLSTSRVVIEQQRSVIRAQAQRPTTCDASTCTDHNHNQSQVRSYVEKLDRKFRRQATRLAFEQRTNKELQTAYSQCREKCDVLLQQNKKLSKEWSNMKRLKRDLQDVLETPAIGRYPHNSSFTKSHSQVNMDSSLAGGDTNRGADSLQLVDATDGSLITEYTARIGAETIDVMGQLHNQHVYFSLNDMPGMESQQLKAPKISSLVRSESSFAVDSVVTSNSEQCDPFSGELAKVTLECEDVSETETSLDTEFSYAETEARSSDGSEPLLQQLYARLQLDESDVEMPYINPSA